MIRLLQRMDDTEPRLPAGGESTSMPKPALRALTVLAEHDESPAEALEDWARGLDWVQWLLSGIRRRMTALHLEDHPGLPQARWASFSQKALPEVLMPHFLDAWQAAQELRLDDLLQLDGQFSSQLTSNEIERSTQAGQLLLKATRHARYQGLLGHLRAQFEAGEASAHFLTVWAAAAQFFQLSLSSAISEYLRLEWALASRSLPKPQNVPDLPALTARLMRGRVKELSVLA